MDSGRTVSYTYDPSGRLAKAVTNGSTSYPQWGLSWTYDRYGNRTAQSISAGCIAITCPTNSLSFSSSGGALTNHADNYSYDASGNMTNDGQNTLVVYDGENRVTSSSGSSASGTYSYDGNGLRVKKVAGGTTTVYIFSGAKVIAEYEGSSPSNLNLTREYVYAGGALLASTAGTTTTYYHQDHLSNRLVTDSAGAAAENLGAYPYGESWYNTSSEKWLFTSYERDAESGNDYAMARYDVNRFGRFSSPDALSGSALDPQSLNHYSYTENDPVNAADPSGMVTVPLVFLSGGFDQGGFDDLWNEFDMMENITFIVPTGGYDGRPLGPVAGTGLDLFNAQGSGNPLDGIVPPSNPNPPPPPGYKDCMKALGESGSYSEALKRATDNWTAIQNAATANGIDSSLIASIGLRETNFRNIPENGYGPFEQGMGVFQIDARYHSDAKAIAYDIPAAADYAAALLADSYATYMQAGYSPDMSLAGAIRSYNASPATTSELLRFDDQALLDFHTTNSNYVGSVLQIISKCFH